MRERILVVEDNPAVLEACAKTLEGPGYEVVQAPSGRVAEEILRTSALDVVITELQMPDIGGLDVLRIAKATDPEIIVILITGFPTVETAVEAMKVGASDYLAKPVAITRLLRVVEGALEKRRTKDAFLRSRLPEVGVEGARRQDPYTFRNWKQVTLKRLGREFLEKTLAEHSGNVTQTAKALGIHRSTLQRLMRRWNLSAS